MSFRQQRLTAYRKLKKNRSMTLVWWEVIQAEATTCQSTPELIPQDMFDFHGNWMVTKIDMLQPWMSSLEKDRGRQLHTCRRRVSERLSSSFDQLDSVALAVEGNDDPSERTARCINDTEVATGDEIWTFYG